MTGLAAGLVTNHTGRTRDGRSAASVLVEAGVDLQVLFGPEHGMSGAAAAGEAVDSGRDPETDLPVVSLYGLERTPAQETLASLDVLLFDIQDIGVRFYTYISTLRNALRAASDAGVAFRVLDRPNPNGGDLVAGPMLDPAFRSFVGTDRLPLLHGMTVGELARLFAAREGAPPPGVVTVSGLRRSTRWEDTGLPWIPPSPNIPDLPTARLYPGFGLFEGVLLSEGRGTPHPFRWLGAPWLAAPRWLAELGGPDGIPGVTLEVIRFTPRSVAAAPEPRFRDEEVSGLAVHLTDPEEFQPVLAGLRAIEAVRATHPEDFGWRRTDRGFWIDWLLGTDRIRLGIEAGVPLAALLEAEGAELEDFLTERAAHLIYPDR